MKRSRIILIVLSGLSFSMWLMAQSSTVQNSPYIDAIKKKWSETPSEDVASSESTESYSEKEKRKLGELEKQKSEEAEDLGVPQQSVESKGYTQDLKVNLGPAESSKGYSEEEKNRLDPADKDSAIEAVNKGKSELRAKKLGKITGTGGFRFGISSTREVTADTAKRYRSFTEIYPPGRTPDLQFFYEYHPYRSELFGSLGLYTGMGISLKNGYGRFQRAPYDPAQQSMGAAENASGRKSDLTDTKFSFLTVPVSLGLSYRFLAFKWIVPYAAIAPTAVFYSERRSNPRSSQWGRSNGLTQIVGIAFSIAGVESAAGWSMYESFRVKNIYLNMDFYRLAMLGSNDVEFSTTAFFAGFSFDI